MLKITVADTAEGQRWTLQGQLAGEGVSELLSSWMATQDSRRGRQCLVNLDDVTVIDEEGEKVLSTMMSDGARTSARGVYTSQLLQDLRSKKKRRMCRFLGRFGQ